MLFTLHRDPSDVKNHSVLLYDIPHFDRYDELNTLLDQSRLPLIRYKHWKLNDVTWIKVIGFFLFISSPYDSENYFHS